jgi:tagaturonate epimerase
VDEFCAPYAAVIDIDQSKLPAARAVNGWSSEQFVSALRHDQKNPLFNPSFRQLLHVSFKIAARKGDRYLNALKKHEAIIARNVTKNLFERHMKPLLFGEMDNTTRQKSAA